MGATGKPNAGDGAAGKIALGAVLGATQIKVAPLSGSGAIDDVAATVANKVANVLLDASTPTIANITTEAVMETANALDMATQLPYIDPIAE